MKLRQCILCAHQYPHNEGHCPKCQHLGSFLLSDSESEAATMAKTKTLKLRARLGKASIGKETASLGFKASRKQLSLEDAEHYFCGSRLQVTIYEDPDPEQKKLPGMDGAHINGVVDVKRFSVSPEQIGGTLSFCEGEINRHEIADFGQRDVLLVAERTGNAAATGGDESDGEE